MKTIEEIDAAIEQEQLSSTNKINKLKREKQKACRHLNIQRRSFFQSTTAHEWDECIDCGKEFNHIDFPA